MTVGYGFSASGSYSGSNVKSDYASIQEQSGIFAGNDGYQINVKNNTDLKGGLITSTQKAEDAGKNQIDTGTLSYSDLKNHSQYDAKAISIGGGLDVNNEQAKQSANQNGLSSYNPDSDSTSKSIGFGLDSDKTTSTTQSGINTSNITIRDGQGQEDLTGKTVEQAKAEIQTDVTTDTAKERSGAIANTFDKDKVQQEIDVQARVTQEFGENAPKAVVDFAQNKANSLRKLGREEEARKWDEGGVYRVAAHSALGALMGGDITSTLAAGGVAASAPTLNKIQDQVQSSLEASGLSKNVAEGLSGFVTTAAAFGIGNTIGGNISTGAISANIDMNNRQLHVDEIAMLQKEAAKLATQNGQMSQDGYEYWFTILYSVAYGKVDSQGRDQLISMAKEWWAAGKNTPDLSLQRLLYNMQFASNIIDSMAGKVLTDNSGKPIIENGAVVKAFYATDSQMKNNSLFGYSINTVGLKAKDDPKSYGSSGVSNRLAQGTVKREQEDLVEGLENKSKGVVPVYPELDLIGSGKLVKETAKVVLEKQAINKLEREVLKKGYTEYSIFNAYPKYTELSFQSLDDQAKFLSNNIEGLSIDQAKTILEVGVQKNTSIVFGGSRIRGDHTATSDIDIGFGNLTANQAGKVLDKLSEKFSHDTSLLKLEKTRITPGNKTPGIPEVIKSPEEFFQRSGIRSASDINKAGQPYKASGSVSVYPNGKIIIIPPTK